MSTQAHRIRFAGVPYGSSRVSPFHGLSVHYSRWLPTQAGESVGCWVWTGRRELRCCVVVVP